MDAHKDKQSARVAAFYIQYTCHLLLYYPQLQQPSLFGRLDLVPFGELLLSRPSQSVSIIPDAVLYSSQ